MFEEKLLRELAAIETTGPILSLYLDVDPKQRTTDEYKLTLREMFKQIAGEADPADIEAVQHYMDLEYDWSGRGLVIFSRQAENIWYALALSVPVRSGVTVARKPYISPLVELDGLYGRYAVILVDRQGAHFHLFQMGEVVAEDGVMGEEIRGLRKGGGSSMVGMRGGAPSLGRKEAALVQRNLREAAKALNAFCQKYHPRRLLLAGAEHTVAQFQEILPAHLQQTVIGTFTSDMEAGKAEIKEHSLKILQELEEKRKKDLVEAVITAAAKGANGVIRLDGTLSAAHEGRIQVLVVERDYHEPGYRCSGCGYLTTQQLGKCPFCNAAFTEIPDAAEAVVTQTVEKGGTVEVVDNDALGQAHIGALLRY
ncbi:MAG: hypothetical protein DRI37_03245 [Chloroflexi bacterium]|nr:MAG: hypothetical protein DRI37_03245 [Chloroflexota bacterium]